MSISPQERPVARAVPAARALVVDDHPIVVDAIVTAISGMRLFDRIDTAHSLAEASRVLERDGDVALAILDLHLADAESRELLLAFRERFPDVPVLVFTGDDRMDSITLAFECGARGYVTKTSPVALVASAIRLVLAGGSYVPPEAMRALGFEPVAHRAPALDARDGLRLSGRQSQVLQLLLRGMPNKVIGARLDMAEGTVKAHLNVIFRALGARSRVEAVLRARELGLV